ncbi:MAG: ABC transporter substrate-binding protein [Oscillospiraceae bacterium]|nr:ABC transporter substrate-binding protein [Oscillospiraceae bacterium]
MKKITSLFLALILLLGILTACASSDSATDTPADDREITDMAGRTVIIPAEIESIFPVNPIAAIYTYMLAPELLLGWNYELNNVERSMILEKYHDLPNLGMGDSINFEAIIAAAPTLAINIAAINDGTISQSDDMADKLGIPVLMLDVNLEKSPDIFRLLGEIFDVDAHAQKLAAYAEKTFDDIAGISLSDSEKVRIYYGNGEDSLQTAPAGSSHGQIIDMVNAVNVAEVESADGSRVQISAEQLLLWNPDVIILNGEPRANLTGGDAADAMLGNGNFATLKAVQNGMVFGTPNAPFSWVDRPQGPNRIIGMRWLAAVVYPDIFDFDVDDEVREFFRLFYHIELSDEQLAVLYRGS